mgnify:CR=1 FL=1
MKPELDVYDRLHIAEIVEYRHISKDEKVMLLEAIDKCRAAIVAGKAPEPVDEKFSGESGRSADASAAATVRTLYVLSCIENRCTKRGWRRARGRGCL